MSQVSWFRRPVVGYLLRNAMRLFQKLGSQFIKKDGSIFIAAPQGFRFADNSSYLFRYLHSQRMEVYYTVNRRDQVEALSKQFGDSIIYAYSFKTFIRYLKASCLVYSYADWDFHPFQVDASKLVINLWHSISIKKLGLAAGMSTIHRLKLNKEMELIDAFVASSKIEADSLFDCFGLKSKKILCSGTPRNDYLIHEKADERLLLAHPELDKKTILYCPTFRNHGMTNLLPFKDFDLKTLDKFLIAHNVNLLVRKHHREWYYDQATGYDELEACKNIFKAGQSEFEEIQELLPHVDILMTDYSGIYFDYLLLNRPIIFAPYDIEEFGQKPGFLFDYDKNTPGPKVYDTTQFMNELLDIINGLDHYADERTTVKNKFHQHQDGQASARIQAFIKSHPKYTQDSSNQVQNAKN